MARESATEGWMFFFLTKLLMKKEAKPGISVSIPGIPPSLIDLHPDFCKGAPHKP